MRESLIEKKVSDYAKEQGLLTYKFSSPSQRGVPDRIFIGKSNVFFIEFKSPGKTPTNLQWSIINKFKDMNITTYVCDGVEQGKQIIDREKRRVRFR